MDSVKVRLKNLQVRENAYKKQKLNLETQIANLQEQLESTNKQIEYTQAIIKAEKQLDNINKKKAAKGYQSRNQVYISNKVHQEYCKLFGKLSQYRIGNLLPDAAVKAVREMKSGTFTISSIRAVVTVKSGKVISIK